MTMWNKKQIKFLKHNAVVSLVGKSGKFRISGDGEVTFVEGTTPVTEDQITTEMDRIQAEYDAQAYARNRELEYPTVQELVVALYDEDDKAAIEAKRAEIKAKYPKP
jgi:hypothetical protein